MSVYSDRAPNCVLNDSKTTETIVLRLRTLLTQTPMVSRDSQVYDIHFSSDKILGDVAAFCWSRCSHKPNQYNTEPHNWKYSSSNASD